ncbi:unnamed protein product [Litomosoides sigmodontis]|uniref:Aftiphilin clathrin-binding box domain-containing protein n=1 Tax=Litomosoides sigmodontis TaxID=42156 RepID=A0A3P6SGM3_LITSI|nr:unnamed protein product [Litomosoides sigmodontis]
MFEDDPPPLPSSPSPEISCDSTFTDLNDHNRFTAVADDDFGGNSEEYCSYMPAILRDELDSKFVNPEATAAHNEPTKAIETANYTQNDSDEEQDGSSHVQFVEISKSQDSPSEIPPCFEDSVVKKNCVMAHSVQKGETTSRGSHDMQPYVKERKASIPTESTKDETNDSSDLRNIDPIGENKKEMIVQNAFENDEDDDEFGDFEKFTKVEKTQKNENDSWAHFESSSFPGVKNKSTETPPLPPLLENLCDDELWATVAREGENNDEQDISDNGIYETLRNAMNNAKVKDRPDEMVWISVSIIEEALALKLQWHNSSIRSCFLHSLNIDMNQTLVRHSDLPVFAQQLEESAVLAPASVAKSSTEVAVTEEKNTSSVSQQVPTRSITVDSLAVPPVQFDWNNSGLTNPLKTGSLSVSSASLDLDFLVSTSSKGAVSDGSPTTQVFSTLQKDLTAFGLNFPDDAEKSKTEKDISSSTSIVLDYVLNKNGDGRKYKPVSELSLDARALHDQLPDLDYMLSNVLLFPVIDR